MTVALRLILIAAIVLVPVLLILVIVLAVAGKGKDKENVAREDGEAVDVPDSYFDGGVLQYIGWNLLAGFLIGLTFGIAYPWAMCMLYRWETDHTVINGRRLKFTGTGGKLFWKYVLWTFLTVITCGIYGIWMGLNLEKWKVEHTVYADDPAATPGKFTAGAGGWFVNYLVYNLLCIVTCFIAAPWAEVRLLRWKARNTVIGGSRLVFKGKGSTLFGKRIGYGLLTGITCGIFGLFAPVKILKWKYSNYIAYYRTAYIRKLSRAHEEEAVKDFAKFRLAANDTELMKLKSGINGNETGEQLKELAENGNPYAKYSVAVANKSEDGAFEGDALVYLKDSADAGYHPAMLDYAEAVKELDEGKYVELLEGSAKSGNLSAPWILKNYYEEKAPAAYAVEKKKGKELLKKCAYWFKIAIEQEHEEALAQKANYELLIDKIALWECGADVNVSVGSAVAASLGVVDENGVAPAAKLEKKPVSKGAVIAILAVAGVILAVIIGLIINSVSFVSAVDHVDRSYRGSKLRTVQYYLYGEQQVVYMKEAQPSEISVGDRIVYFKKVDSYNNCITTGYVDSITEGEDGKLIFSVDSDFITDGDGDGVAVSQSSGFSVNRILAYIPIVNLIYGYTYDTEIPALSGGQSSADGVDDDVEDDEEITLEDVNEQFVLGVYEKDAGGVNSWLATGPFEKDHSDYVEAKRAWVDYKEVGCFYGDTSDYGVSYWDVTDLTVQEEYVVDYFEMEDMSSFTIDDGDGLFVSGGFSKETYDNGNYRSGDFNTVHPEYIDMKFSLDPQSTESVYIATSYVSGSDEMMDYKSTFEILSEEIKPGTSLEKIPVTEELADRLVRRQMDGYARSLEMDFFILVLRENGEGETEYAVSDRISLQVRVYEESEMDDLRMGTWCYAYREGDNIYFTSYGFGEDYFGMNKLVIKNAANTGKHVEEYDSYEGWYVDEYRIYEGSAEYVNDGEFYVENATVTYKETTDGMQTDVTATEVFSFNEISDAYIIMTDMSGKTQRYEDCFAMWPGHKDDMIEMFEVFNLDVNP